MVAVRRAKRVVTFGGIVVTFVAMVKSPLPSHFEPGTPLRKPATEEDPTLVRRLSLRCRDTRLVRCWSGVLVSRSSRRRRSELSRDMYRDRSLLNNKCRDMVAMC